MTMFDHQKKYIFDPIVNEVTNQRNKKLKVLALATGAGKTHTISKYVIPYLLDNSLAEFIVYTTPNTASMADVEADLKSVIDTSQVDIRIERDFTGASSMPTALNKKTVVVCHPTYLSVESNRKTFIKLAKEYSTVGFSDEAHVGMQAANVEEAIRGYGYNIHYYPAEWNTTIRAINPVAWFQVTATPRNTVDGSDYMELASEFYDTSILGQRQPRPREVYLENVNIMDDSVISETSAEYFNARHQSEAAEVEELSKKWGFPKAKPVGVFSGTNEGSPGSAVSTYHKLARVNPSETTTIAISGQKKLNGTTGRTFAEYLGANPTTDRVIGYINDNNTKANTFVGNNVIGNAVNIPNITLLYTSKRHQTTKDTTCTQSVLQLLGRPNRWPEVEGLNSWDDVFMFELEQKAMGVPAEAIDRWIDLVFGYIIFMPYSPINEAGLNDYFGHHTHTFDDWNKFIARGRKAARSRYVENMRKARNVRKRSNNVVKTPYAQAGTLEYRDLKGDSCAFCPEIPGTGVPACEYVANELGFTPQNYKTALHVHHENGDHLGKVVVTVCANVHSMITDREGHAKNLKYRVA